MNSVCFQITSNHYHTPSLWTRFKSFWFLPSPGRMQIPQHLRLRHLHLPPLPHSLYRRSYYHKEGKNLGDVAKYLGNNIYKEVGGGNVAKNYFVRTEKVPGVHSAMFQALILLLAAGSPLYWTQQSIIRSRENDNIYFILHALRTWREFTRFHHTTKPTINHYILNRNPRYMIIIINIVHINDIIKSV